MRCLNCSFENEVGQMTCKVCGHLTESSDDSLESHASNRANGPVITFVSEDERLPEDSTSVEESLPDDKEEDISSHDEQEYLNDMFQQMDDEREDHQRILPLWIKIIVSLVIIWAIILAFIIIKPEKSPNVEDNYLPVVTNQPIGGSEDDSAASGDVTLDGGENQDSNTGETPLPGEDESNLDETNEAEDGSTSQPVEKPVEEPANDLSEDLEENDDSENNESQDDENTSEENVLLDGFIASGYFNGGSVILDQSVSSIRLGSHEDYDRLVIDLSSSEDDDAQSISNYNTYFDGSEISIVFTNVDSMSDLSLSLSEDSIISSVTSEYVNSNKDGVIIRINLKENVIGYKAFELESPGRLVVDIQK